MGLMKGQAPGEQLCGNDPGALVDALFNLPLKRAFVAKNNSLWAKCCQQLKEAFLLLYSTLVGQFWTDGSNHDLPREKIQGQPGVNSEKCH